MEENSETLNSDLISSCQPQYNKEIGAKILSQHFCFNPSLHNDENRQMM